MTHALSTALRFLGLLTLVLGLAQAAPPSTINYQGYLTNAGGTPVTNPAVAMTFSLFSAPSGGAALWSESQSVAVNGGVFNVVLGTGSLVGGSPLGSLAFDVPYYLEITAGGETLSPRTALTSSPYAFRAATLDPAATVAGAVPPGYMILGTTTVAPPGFDLMGPLAGGYYVFVRQGVVVQRFLLSTQSVTVNENGGTATFTVALAAVPPANVTVSISSDNTASATVSPGFLTFTPANFATPQTVTVTGVPDANAANDLVTISLSASSIPPGSVAVTTIEDDVQSIVRSVPSLNVVEGGTGTFTVRLAFQPLSDVTVTVTSGNPAAAAISPGFFTFTPANYATPQTVTVTGVPDVNLTNESVTVTLSSPGIASPTVAVFVTDDDVQGIGRSLLNLNVAEGGTGTFGVWLYFQPASAVTVTLASNNTAAATVSPGFLTFTPANYSTLQTVTVSGTQDANTINESVQVTASSPGATSTTVFVTVTDDDVQAIVASVPSLTVAEGSTGTFTVRLAFQPASTVTVNVASSNTAAATVSPAILTFTPANYATPQTVTVTGVSDANLVTDTATITVSASGIAPVQVSVTVTDTGP